MKFSLLALLSLSVLSSASASDAQIVLKYSADSKADLVDEGVYETAQFTDDNIIVTEGSPLDVMLLLNDETSPDSRCFNGKASEAKTLLEAMIENTDGNGEHYLEKMKVSVDAQSRLSAKFQVHGPSGKKDHSLTISACKN